MIKKQKFNTKRKKYSFTNHLNILFSQETYFKSTKKT